MTLVSDVADNVGAALGHRQHQFTVDVGDSVCAGMKDLMRIPPEAPKLPANR